ncbi:MAG: AAA family ATPase [Eubacteriales bacterium]|nr:AAA family ATPase [Eubacteriales bacterium]
MGIYLNPGNEYFQEALNSKIYVDKTGLIAYTNEVIGTSQKFVCVSRPRRFGKSMAAGMLAAYYGAGCDSREMFRGLEIFGDSSFDAHLNRYNVLFLNIQDFLGRSEQAGEVPACIQKAVGGELRKAYSGQTDFSDSYLPVMLAEIFEATGKGFVFIIDEWDCIFREKKKDVQAQTEYLDFLKNLLKDKTYVKLAYMTGILPIKKYGTHSALNMFDEYSMMNPKALAKYVGFTEMEVQKLCRKYGMDFEEAQRWYDGYRFRRVMHVYSPKSVVDAMRNREFDNYWIGTETYEALKIYIDMNFDGLCDDIILMLGGGKCKINPRTFQNDMTTFKNKDDVFSLLVHLGYLAYDIDRSEVFIPNMEVETEFANAVEAAGWDEVIRAISASEKLLEATLKRDEEAVAEGIDSVHMENTSILNYNNENSLSCVISLAYYSARKYYTLVREMPSGKGFADMVFLPHRKCADKPVIVAELKWDKTAEGAIAQIKEKRYVKALENFSGSMLLVGINYDKESKEHKCVIEEWDKK